VRANEACSTSDKNSRHSISFVSTRTNEPHSAPARAPTRDSVAKWNEKTGSRGLSCLEKPCEVCSFLADVQTTISPNINY